MCGGGGGSSGGNDWTYQANIDRDLENQRQQQVQGQIAATAQEKADLRNKFNTDIAGTDAYGRGVAQSYFGERGLPFDEGIYNSVAANVRNSIPDLDPNPNKYFTREAFGRELDTVAQGTRDRLGNEIKTQFAPGFEKTLISDAADDPYIDSILNEQRTPALKALDFNKARGVLNDTGYTTALSALDKQGTTARGTLGDIGQSVLGKYRQGLSDIRGEAGQAASSYDYGQTAPDIGSYYGRATNLAGENLKGLEASIRSALGTTNLYDAPLALQEGGTLQGPINLTTRPASGVQFAEAKKNDQGRGLGSTGVF